MKLPRTGLVRRGRPDVYERRARRLDEFLEKERKASQANWALIETAKLTRARLALFGSAPK